MRPTEDPVIVPSGTSPGNKDRTALVSSLSLINFHSH